MYRILIVEDDTTIASAVAQELESWGYEAVCAEDFSDVMGCFARVSPHLVLLDLGLPRYNGFHWCREIRRVSQAPVVFLSSAADNMNQLTALHQGADDFIAKPFALPLLVAKVQALLRRTFDFSAPAELLSHRGVTLDLAAAVLVYGESRVPLTRNELGILRLLMENAGRVVTREAIMRCLWDDENFIDDNTLTVNIARLRQTLAQAGLPDFITTKKGMGYTVL